MAGAATLAAKPEASRGRTMANLLASGIWVFGISLFGISVCGVGVCGGWRAADRVGVGGLIDVVAVAIGLEH